MKIVLTGGGSGGHITPILAVADELKRLCPDVEVVYIGQKGDALADIPAEHPTIDTVYAVRAGKFRRYHGAGAWQLFDIPTLLKNVRDVWYVGLGLLQSYRLLKKIKPDVVFTRGGFVSVPVALAAKVCGVPYITHDSDAIPSLANRIIARWAALHAVALPKEIYPYPSAKTITVGIPISDVYRPVSGRDQTEARKALGLEAYEQVLLVTGGGNGAQRLNESFAACVPELLKRYPSLAIVQLAGRALEAELKQKYHDALKSSSVARVQVHGYVTNFVEYSKAANCIIMRAGATSMAEAAAQAKACIVVPNPYLTGGHQIKNAEVLEREGAIRMVREDKLAGDATLLLREICSVLDSPNLQKSLGEQLHAFAHPDAAHTLAMILLKQT